MKSKNLKRIAINFLVTLIFIYSYGGLFLIPNSSLTRGIIFSPGPLVVLILLLFIFSQTFITRKKGLNKPRINFFFQFYFLFIKFIELGLPTVLQKR